jgi:hypothetical protein
MNDKILHKLEKYRNKIKYEDKNDDKYLSKLELYLNKYLNRMSGGAIYNFETIDEVALINSKGITLLFGTYFPANIQIRGKSYTKTVFEYIVVPYGSATPIYMYYYLDNFVDENKRKRTYLRNIQTRKRLPKVNAPTNIYTLKLYIYAYNQEIAIGKKDLQDEIKDQIKNLRFNFDSKFTSYEKRRMQQDAQDSRRFNEHIFSHGNNIDLYDSVGYEPGEPGEPGEPKSILSKPKEKYDEIKIMLEKILAEKFPQRG